MRRRFDIGSHLVASFFFFFFFFFFLGGGGGGGCLALYDSCLFMVFVFSGTQPKEGTDEDTYT